MAFGDSADSKPAVDASGRMSSHAWWTVAVIMMLQATAMVDRNIISLVLIEIRKDLGLNDFEVSMLHGAAFAAFYCTAGLFIGSMVDRHSVKRILYFAVTVWSLATTAVGLSKSFWGMMAARMMTGAGEGGINPSSQALIASIFPKNRMSLPMALFSVAGSIGLGLSYFGGGLLLDVITKHSVPGLESLAPWRQVMIIAGAPGLLLAFLAFTVLEPRARGGKPTFTPVSWAVFGKFLAKERQIFMRFGVGFGLVSIINYGVASWAPTYARRVLEMSPTEIGTLMGIMSAGCAIVVGAFYGNLVDRQFSRGQTDFLLRSYGIGILIALPLVALGYILDTYAAFFVGLLALQCIFYGFFGPVLGHIQMITPPEMRGRTAAVSVLVINLLGYGVGPMIIGALTDFVFGDPQKLGLSIATAVIVLTPIAAWGMLSSRSHFMARVGSGSTSTV